MQIDWRKSNARKLSVSDFKFCSPDFETQRTIRNKKKTKSKIKKKKSKSRSQTDIGTFLTTTSPALPRLHPILLSSAQMGLCFLFSCRLVVADLCDEHARSPPGQHFHLLCRKRCLPSERHNDTNQFCGVPPVHLVPR